MPNLLLTLYFVPSLSIFLSIARRLSILLVFLKNYLIDFLIFSTGCIFSISLISALSFFISLLIHPLSVIWYFKFLFL